jgi:hypothetical protein
MKNNHLLYIVSFIIGATVPYLSVILDKLMIEGWGPFRIVPIASYPAFLMILYSLVLKRQPRYWDNINTRLWGMFSLLLGHLIFWIPQEGFSSFYYFVGPVASPYTETSWVGFFLYMAFPALVAAYLATLKISKKLVHRSSVKPSMVPLAGPG